MSMTVASVDEMNRSYMLEDNSLPFLILATKLQLRNLHMNMKKMNVIQSEGWPPKDLLSWSQKRQSSLRKLVRWFYFYVKTKVTETLRNQTSNRWLAGIRIVDKAQRSGTVEVNDLCRYSMKTREVNQKSRFFFVFVSPPQYRSSMMDSRGIINMLWLDLFKLHQQISFTHSLSWLTVDTLDLMRHKNRH